MERDAKRKRNRYTTIACNECKRRKIKCNGRSPCERCDHLNFACVYAPNCCTGFKETPEYCTLTADVSELQDQVQVLISNFEKLKSDIEQNVRPESVSISPNLESSLRTTSTPPSSAATSIPLGVSGSKYPRFHGPTSAAYGLVVAKTSLNKQLGISSDGDQNRASGLQDPRASSSTISPIATPPPVHTNPSRPIDSKDVLRSLAKADALRLIKLWEQQVHIMYPVVNMTRLTKTIEHFYTRLPSQRVPDDDMNTLRLVLANSAELESSGSSQYGSELFRNVAPYVETIMMRSPSFEALEHLVLASLFYFHRDDEILAYRLTGIAARLCFEMGLYRQDSYMISMTTNGERYRANVLFWTIYVLDRRWSFGVGLPFVLQEMDLDRELVRPENEYLANMVSLSSIGSRIWPRVTNDYKDINLNIEELEHLDLQVVSWQQRLPDHLIFNAKLEKRYGGASDITSRLRVVLHLRANQTRILIGRQVLMSTHAIQQNPRYAEIVVNVAKDTIHILRNLHQTTEAYHKQQGLFNYFLISALAALFLAVAHFPKALSGPCRNEFYMALDIVRGLSASSFLGKRFWRTIEVLKEIGPKIGLIPHVAATETSSLQIGSPNAAMTTARLVRHTSSNIPLYHQQIFAPPPLPPPAISRHESQPLLHHPTPLVSSNDSIPWGSWQDLANDFGGLFEAVGNMPGPITPIKRGNDSDPREVVDNMFTPTTNGLSKAFRNLF